MRPSRAPHILPATVQRSTCGGPPSTSNTPPRIRPKTKEYAEGRGIYIARIYSNDSKSALSTNGRDALQRLIRDVQSGDVDFTIILDCAVCRRERFQDAVESAYYE